MVPLSPNIDSLFISCGMSCFPNQAIRVMMFLQGLVVFSFFVFDLQLSAMKAWNFFICELSKAMGQFSLGFRGPGGSLLFTFFLSPDLTLYLFVWANLPFISVVSTIKTQCCGGSQLVKCASK